MRKLIEALLKYDHFLVVSHEKPDGDAIGSTLGLTRFLLDNGKTAQALLIDPVPEKFDSLIHLPYQEQLAAADLGRFACVILLDCARASRANLGTEVTFQDLQMPVINIDHHTDNDIRGDNCINYVDGQMAATAEIITHLAEELEREYQWKLSAESATMLYLGVVTDTGSFRFSNTTSGTFASASTLLAHGASIEAVVNAAFFSKKANQQQFEAEMVSNCLHFEFGGKYLWAYLPKALFDKYHFDMRDGETVIELLREIDQSVIVALIYPKGDVFKISLRSKDARYPVGPIARSLGGGGHEMASGVTISHLAPEQLFSLLSNKIGLLLES